MAPARKLYALAAPAVMYIWQIAQIQRQKTESVCAPRRRRLSLTCECASMQWMFVLADIKYKDNFFEDELFI
jgi:hypothetical protein